MCHDVIRRQENCCPEMCTLVRIRNRIHCRVATNHMCFCKLRCPPPKVADSIQALLKSGKALRFPFNYREDYHAELAYLVFNDEGHFVLIGNPTKPQWMELDQVIEEGFEDEVEDDLDFEMF